MAKSNREAMAKKIINSVFRNGGKVFGGYVRDMISGEAFNDIDVYLPSAEAQVQFLLDLTMIGAVEVRTPMRMYNTLGGIKIVCSEMGFPNPNWDQKIEIDCITQWTHLPDCDVNRLVLTESGIHTESDVKFVEVLGHIRRREFVPEYLCSQSRKEKMLDREWLIVDSSGCVMNGSTASKQRSLENNPLTPAEVLLVRGLYIREGITAAIKDIW